MNPQKINMEKDELLQLFDNFINENGLVPDFMNYLEEKGYSESEYDNVLEQTKK